MKYRIFQKLLYCMLQMRDLYISQALKSFGGGRNVVNIGCYDHYQSVSICPTSSKCYILSSLLSSSISTKEFLVKPYYLQMQKALGEATGWVIARQQKDDALQSPEKAQRDLSLLWVGIPKDPLGPLNYPGMQAYRSISDLFLKESTLPSQASC